MLISHTHKFIFIHIYKNAGTSIVNALGDFASFSGIRNTLISALDSKYKFVSDRFEGHITACDLKLHLPDSLFSYFKFAIVRNPWDWQVSLYHFALQNKDHFQHEFIKRLSFDEYIDWRIHKDISYQKDFVTDLDGNLIVDFVCHFENLDKDFLEVLKKIGLPKIVLPKMNQSMHKSYLEYYNQETYQMVEQAFRDDIIFFGYNQ